VAGGRRLAALNLLPGKWPLFRTLFGFTGDDFATDNGFPTQIKKSGLCLPDSYDVRPQFRLHSNFRHNIF
jgi:hypothetical protein